MAPVNLSKSQIDKIVSPRPPQRHPKKNERFRLSAQPAPHRPQGAGATLSELSVVLDTRQIFADMQTAVSQVLKPNVLLCGSSGAGKSSIVNAVFGRKLAETGSGMPITQHFECFAPDDKPIVIFDSKGLEHGKEEEFVGAMKGFLAQRRSPNTTEEDLIHVVWYVVNLGTARFQEYDARICRELLADVPIIFLLNKADMVDESVVTSIRTVILGLGLKACYGIFGTSANPMAAKVPEKCPKCDSDEIIVRKKTGQIICEDCGYEAALKPAGPLGLDTVIQATIAALPEWSREAFVCAQTVSSTEKDHTAISIITDHCQEVSAIVAPSAVQLSRIITTMAARLGGLYDFVNAGRMQGAERGEEVARQFKGILRRIQLAITSMFAQASEAECTLASEGIMLYRGFRNRYLTMLAAKSGNPAQLVQEDLEGSDLRRVLHALCREKGVDFVLRTYLTADVSKPVSPADSPRRLTMRSSPAPPQADKKDDKKDDKKEDKEKAAGKLFGAKLEDVRMEGDVPFIIRHIMEYIVAENGLQEEGIFRISGNSDTINDSRRVYEAGNLPKFVNVHDASGTLKLYLRELAEPLVPFAFYTDFIRAQRDTQGDETAKITELRKVVDKFPAAHRQTLKVLIDFLRKIAANHTVNKMTPLNLGVVFGPDLARPQVETMQSAIYNTPVCVEAVQNMVQHGLD